MKMFTRNLAVELDTLGISINNVATGAIATPINTKPMILMAGGALERPEAVVKNEG